MNIGCITLIRRNGKMLGVQCNKGRGYILPGGKHEYDETFIECARREFKEETGLDAENFRFVFQAPDGFGFMVLCFTANLCKDQAYEIGEMQVEEVTWEQLKQSKYKAYYELLEQAMVT